MKIFTIQYVPTSLGRQNPGFTNLVGVLGMTILAAFLLTGCSSSHGSQGSGTADPASSSPASSSTSPGIPAQAGEATLEFKSKEITAGKLEEMTEVVLTILLPPSYEKEPGKRYPVIYHLHGFGGSASELADTARSSFEQAWAKGACPEFIVVGIPGGNSMGGSFYVDSPATGNWQSMITREVIPLIDSSYRTLPQPEKRMVTGFSMGGFGAWNLALSAPASISWAWACCPGALAPDGLTKAMDQWDYRFKAAYGAAFAPDLELEEPYAAVPDDMEGDRIAKTLELWQAGFGDIEGKLKSWTSRGKALKSVRFDYGGTDWYTWIPEGTRYTAAAMKKAGIDVEIQEWPSGHEISPALVAGGLIPFIRKAFGQN